MSSRGQQAVWSVLAMLTFWCIINSVKINNTIDEQQTVSWVVQDLANKYEEEQRKAMLKKHDSKNRKGETIMGVALFNMRQQ